MKNLFFCVVLALFAVAWTANLDRNGRDVQVRVKRQFDWFQSAKDTKKKDDKKKKDKKKKQTTTVKPTTPSTTVPPITTSPTSTGPVNPSKMPESELKKILKMKSRDELEKYMGISKQMKKDILANYTKNLPQDLARVADGQSALPANPDCGCAPTLTRVFAKQQSNGPPLGMHFPGCMATITCGGTCLNQDLQECRPTVKRTVFHYLLYIYYPYVGKPPEYQKHDVEYHVSCDCMCRPQKCNERQVFVKDQCSCKCKPEYSPDKLRCSDHKVDFNGMQISFQYDDSTCSCVCPFNHYNNCPASLVWDKKLCKCICQNKCLPGEILDKKTCKCNKVAMSNNCP